MFAKTTLRPPTSKSCCVSDLDDTLCYYDKTKRLPRCHEFAPIPNVLAEVRRWQSNGNDLVIASARPAWTLPRTLEWLGNHGLAPVALYLRDRSAQEVPPHELKTQMLTDILSQWNVVQFYDDFHLTCIQAQTLGIPTTYVSGNQLYWRDKCERMQWNLPTNFNEILFSQIPTIDPK